MMTHGNLINRVLENTTPVTPVVGMGATECCWSDRHAFTVVAVSPTGKTCTVQRDNAVLVGRPVMGDGQVYTYSSDTNGSKRVLRQTKKGWACGGRTFILGTRDERYDYSF